ncbi:MAG: LiaF-related protein [candidate division KSB1 bacterium]|nr:LiaF-related protein [candidate division KSB1 bacterium]
MKQLSTIILACFLMLTARTSTAFSMIEYQDTFVIKDHLSLELDIDGAELEVRSHASVNQCQVYIEYSKENCDVDVQFNPERGTLHVSTDSDFWKMKNNKGKAPSVKIDIPTGVKVEIDANIKAGEIEFKFGEIHLTGFELRNWAGETAIEFSKPNRELMKSFDVNCKVGEVNLLNLGNARFEEAEINSGIGELNVDFSGDLLEKVMARIDLDLGETHITVPEEPGAKLRVSKTFIVAEINIDDWFNKEGQYYYSKNYRTAEKSLYLIITTGLGELSIDSI